MSTSSPTDDLLAALDRAIERAREARCEVEQVRDEMRAFDDQTGRPTLPDLALIARGEDRTT